MADLSEFLDQYIHRHSGPDFLTLKGGYFGRLLKQGQNEESMSTVLSVLLWQILIETRAYADLCSSLNLWEVPWYERDLKVVAHGETQRPQFDLLILDRAYTNDPRAVPLQPQGDDLLLAFRTWHNVRQRNINELIQSERVTDRRAQQLEALLDAVDSDFAIQVLHKYEFHVLLAHMPELEYTSVPTVPWKASPVTNPSCCATAGVVVRQGGLIGVTVPTHALLTNGLTNPVGWGVDVNGQTGTVVSCDVISDSCFVTLASVGPPNHAYRSTLGLLNAFAPSHKTTGYFEGCGTGGRRSGQITSVNVNAFNQHPLIQQTFDLNYLTNQGDSGCALLDSNDYILGFALCRTTPNSNPSFSTWVWAESVLTYHKLVLM